MVRLTYQQLGDIARSRAVRKKLDQVRDRLAVKAQALADAEDVDVPVERTSGTRPKGRPYSRLSIPAENEFGDSKTKRLRILGRVIGR